MYVGRYPTGRATLPVVGVKEKGKIQSNFFYCTIINLITLQFVYYKKDFIFLKNLFLR